MGNWNQILNEINSAAGPYDQTVSIEGRVFCGAGRVATPALARRHEVLAK